MLRQAFTLSTRYNQKYDRCLREIYLMLLGVSFCSTFSLERSKEEKTCRSY
jgi:hypothetical protein